MARWERKMEGGGREKEEALTMIYLHSLLHYSSHLPHNICFFFRIYTYFKRPTVNVQP